jgi:hypothetical protein
MLQLFLLSQQNKRALPMSAETRASFHLSGTHGSSLSMMCLMLCIKRGMVQQQHTFYPTDRINAC